MKKFGGSGFGGRQQPPPSRKDAPPSSDEEDEEEEEEEMTEEGLEGLERQRPNPEEEADLLQAVIAYTKDPLKPFIEQKGEGSVVISKDTASGIYAARGVVAAEIDPALGPNGAFAEEFRAIERERLATMKEKLFLPRRAAAEKEVAGLKPDQLLREGTGLMWTQNMHEVVEETHEVSPDVIAVELTERDEAIFNHCIDVEPSFIDDDPFKGVSFTFHFAKNPFFSNTSLRSSFAFPCASLSLTRFGIETPFVSSVTSDTPVQWIGDNKFEQPAQSAIEPRDVKLKDLFVDAIVSAADKATATPATLESLKKMICLWTRSLFTVLFDTNTTAEAKALIEKGLIETTDAATGVVVRDEAYNGVAAVRAAAFEMRSWNVLWRKLKNITMAPMIHIIDAASVMGDDEEAEGDEEEEEGEEEEDDDDSSEEEGAKPKATKQHRKESGGSAPKPPADCKQQ